MSNTTPPSLHTRALMLLGPLLALALVLGAWWLFDLRAFDSPRKIAEAVGRLAENPLAPLYTLLIFGVGSLLFFPVTPLVLGTALAFDALHSILYNALGLQLATLLTYGAGRLLGSKVVEQLSGPRLAKLARTLRSNAFRAGIIARVLPVGNFTLINLTAGSLRIPLWRFLLGNVIGFLPGVLITTLFARQLVEAAGSTDRRGAALVAGAGLLLGALLLLVKRVLGRRANSDDADRRAPPDSANG
jgi:uncharacterized membrane protein YdjX (TVP38/TMEM64 family)